MGNIVILGSILLPILGGVLLFGMNLQSDRARNWFCECVACVTTFFVWAAILTGPYEAVTVYSFARSFTVSFHVDGMSMMFAGMVSLMWPLVLLYAFEYMEHARHKNGFFGFFLMTYGVTLGIAFSASMTTLYVFFEMLTLVTIPLVSHYQDHESMYAGRIYAAYTIGGAAVALIAVVMTTMQGSSLFSFGGVDYRNVSAGLMQWIYLLGFFGFGVKAAVFPLYRWLPLASVAPTPVTALLHAVAVVNSGVFAIVRLTYYTYSPDALRGTWVQAVCLLTAAFTLTYEAVLGVRERHFKKRLAYSTVSNLSYMLFGILLMSPVGMTAGVAHMLFHGITKISLFMCAGAFMHSTGNSYIYEINGAGKRMPVTFALFTLNGFSLMGIPLFCGFVSKWNLFTAGASDGTWVGLTGMVCLAVGAFFCAIYTMSISIRAFFPFGGTDRYRTSTASDPGALMLAPILVFTAADLLFGLFPGPVMTFIGNIASGLI